jgi:hypothetical protein
MCHFLRKFLVLPCLLAFASCEKEAESPVPGIDRFQFDVNLLSEKYKPLYSSITAVEVSGYGYNKHGIIIYRHVYDNEMLAYDATCVNSGNCIEKGRVRPDSNNQSFGKCELCGSAYSFTDGMHTEKRLQLRAYFIRPVSNATDLWRVSNW